MRVVAANRQTILIVRGGIFPGITSFELEGTGRSTDLTQFEFFQTKQLKPRITT